MSEKTNDDNMIVDKNITSMKNIESNKINKTKNVTEYMSISKISSLLDEITITNDNDQPDGINDILSEKQVNPISNMNQLSEKNSNKKQSQSDNNICTRLKIRAIKESIKNIILSAHANNDILILNSQYDKEQMKDSNISVELIESLFPLENQRKKLKSPTKPAPKKRISEKIINVHATELDNLVKNLKINKTIGTSKRKLYSKDIDENLINCTYQPKQQDIDKLVSIKQEKDINFHTTINLDSLHEALNSDKDTFEEQDGMITKQLTPLLIDGTNQQNQRERDNLQSITRYRSNKNSFVIQDEVVSKQVTPCSLPPSNNNKNYNKDIKEKRK